MLAAFVLEGATAEERQYARINDAAATCTVVGFRLGSREHTSCTAQIYQDNEASRRQDMPLIFVF
jgi:hypothetical protein